MGNVKFELNPEGVRELLTGPEMQAILQGYAQSVAGQYGADTETDIYVGPNRANAMVFQRKGDTSNDLLKAVGRANND